MKTNILNEHEYGITNPNLLGTLLNMPSKIMQHYDVNGLVQMVLHELAHDKHLAFKRATYLVDSPDFDCLRGLAGFCREECRLHQQDLWQDPHHFASAMREASFHASMQKLLGASLHKNHLDAAHKDNLLAFGKALGMEAPEVYVWNLKHGNHGILLYEENSAVAAEKTTKQALDHASALLGLCHA